MSKQRLPAPIQRQVDEANKVLAELARKPGEPEPAAPGAAAGAAPAPETPLETTSAAPVSPPATVSPPSDDKDYRQMYGVLKGKYDKEIPELKVAIGELTERNRQNETLLAQLADRTTPTPAGPGSPLPGPESFSEQEREEYGKEFFDVVGRRAREVIAAELQPFKKQMSELNGQTSYNKKIEEERARSSVTDALDEQVVGWQSINTDQTFLAWLAGSDVFSNRTKRELLTEAFQANDAARVVRFFKAFQEDAARSPAPAARIPSVDAGSLMAPGTPRSGGPAVAPGGDGRVWTQAEIGQFYTQVRRGKVPTDEKIRVEKEIVKAAAEGRVR